VLPVTGPVEGAAAGSAEGDALTELLGLKKLPSLNLDVAVGLTAGVAVASVIACLRGYVAFGDSARNAAAVGEAAVSAGEAVASVFFCWRCFLTGEGDSAGNSTI
jgi:hypothetical protein